MISAFKRRYMVRGSVSDAWERCLPVWRRDGGINDFRGIGGKPFYAPSSGRRLAQVFAKHHSSSVVQLLSYTQDADATIAICAVDLLTEIGAVASETISVLTESSLPLAQTVRTVLEADAEMAECAEGNAAPSFATVGSYFAWQFERFPDETAH